MDIGRRAQPTSEAYRTSKERDPNRRFIPLTIGCLSVCLASVQKRNLYIATGKSKRHPTIFCKRLQCLLLGAGRSRRNKHAQNKSGTHCGNEVLELARSEQNGHWSIWKGGCNAQGAFNRSTIDESIIEQQGDGRANCEHRMSTWAPPTGKCLTRGTSILRTSFHTWTKNEHGMARRQFNHMSR